MKHIAILTLVLAFASPLFAGGDKEAEAPAKAPQPAPAEAPAPAPVPAATGTGQIAVLTDKIAKVNSTFIMKADLDTELEKYLLQARQQGQTVTDDQLLKLKQNVLQTLINQNLVLQEYERLGLAFDASTVDARIEEYKGQFASIDEYKSQLSRLGISEAQLRNELTKQEKFQEVIGIAVENVNLKAEDSRKYYDANIEKFQVPELVRASHILILTGKDATEAKKAEALKKITLLKKKVDAGEDFAALAKEFSEGPSAPNGGDLGVFQRGDMVKPFEDAAFALQAGETSGIVESEFGYHIIRVFAHEQQRIASYEEVKDELESQLLSAMQQQVFNKMMLDLRSKAEITIFPPELRVEGLEG